MNDKGLVVVGARISEEEMSALEDLASVNDRTVAREIRRAIRFYLSNSDLAERQLKERASG